METMKDIYEDATPLVMALNNELGLLDTNNNLIEVYIKEHFESYNNMIQQLSPDARELITYSNAHNLEEILEEIKLIQKKMQKATGKAKEDLLKAFRIKVAYFRYVLNGITEMFDEHYSGFIHTAYSTGDFSTYLRVITNEECEDFTIDIGQYPIVPIQNLQSTNEKIFNNLLNDEINYSIKISKIKKLLKEIKKKSKVMICIGDFYHNNFLHETLIAKDSNWRRVSHYIETWSEPNIVRQVFGIVSPDEILKFLQDNNRIPDIQELEGILPLKACD